jgi:beta-N-acetylhexosaminidase
VPDDLLARLRQGKAAGVLWFGDNFTDAPTSAGNAAAIQAATMAGADPAPALIATDQEGGDIRRIPGPPDASAQMLGQQSTAIIHDQAKAAALTLRQWGVNVDLAPVADIARAGSFESTQQRSFGTDAKAVADDVVAFVGGLRDGGVAATLKHFPGLGAAATNTDIAPSVVNIAADILHSTDIAPFTAGVGAGAELVMMSSAQYPALDAAPAVMSRPIVQNLLRRDLAFTGVVVSDAFDTPAVASFGPMAEVIVAAANAGVDLFVSSFAPTCGSLQEALSKAITDGRVSRADAEAAYARIMNLRHHLST